MGSKADWVIDGKWAANLPSPLFNYPKFFEKDKEISKGKLKPVVSFVKA
jgi:hypothetical protein